MRISLTLAVYAIRNFALWFMAVLMVIMGLILLFDLIELIRRSAANADATLMMLGLMAGMKLPQMVQTVLPFAVMIGAMVVFWRLSRTHELVIIRASGVSVWQFLIPIVLMVFLFGSVMVAAFNPLAAAMYSRYQQMEDEVLLHQDSPLTVTKGGLWLLEKNEQRNMIVTADQVRQEDFSLIMRGVTVFVKDHDGQFKYRIEARMGSLENGYLDLQKVMILEQGKSTEKLEKLELPTSLTLARIQESFASPETLSVWDLPKFIDFFETSGFSAHKHLMQLHELLASPFLLCAMVLVAAIFSMQPNPRRGGAMWRIVGGVGAGFLLYFFSKLTFALGQNQTLPLVLAAWSPAGVTILLGLGALFHQEDG